MFQFDSSWDIDKEAESLNTSLFGKAKKKGHQLSSLPRAKKSSGLFTSIIHDSDDETFSKKGKKRLKERRRKNKKHDGTSNVTSTSDVRAFTDGENEDLVQSLIREKGKKGRARQVSKQIIGDNAAHKTGGNAPNVNKKKKEKWKLDTNSNADETDSRQSNDKKEKRKRKRSHTENPIDEESGSKSKKVKTEKDGPKLANAAAENTTPQEGKRKRRRNRKKKNNSKKNKYKHLALNSKDKIPDSNSPDTKSNGGFPDKREDSQKRVLSNTKTKEVKKVTQTAQTVPAKQTSYPESVRSQSKEKKAEKRKHNEAQNGESYKDRSEENHQDVTDKKKKKKKNKNMNMSLDDVADHNMSSHEEITDRSLALPAKAVAQTSVHNTPSLKTPSKPKLKQHILAKMLNGIEFPNQSETQETSAKKKKKDKKLKQGVQSHDASSLGCNLQQLSPKQTASSKAQSLKNDIAAKSKKEIQSQTKKTQPSAMKVASDSASSPATKSLWGKAAELGQNAKEKLDSARFRFINEQLYTCKGDEALGMFRDDKEAFSVYHQGFENQVKKWPVNPQNVIIKQLKEKPTELEIADFGCGDAKLAQSLPHKVHSFDLVALNNRVTVCDMSKTPLPSEKVDIAVFCLSLMGTNINDYIAEANRILKTGGLLKIAEVVSRFSGVSRFIEGVCSHGFQLLNKRDLSQMFYMMDFRKVKSVKKSAAVSQIKLKPCVYKRR